jgi:hypothetical protein
MAWITELFLFYKTRTIKPFQNNEYFEQDYANIEGTKGFHVDFWLQCRVLYLENLFKILQKNITGKRVSQIARILKIYFHRGK